MLHKEYFYRPQWDSHAVHHLKEGWEGRLVLGNLATVLSCIDPSVGMVTKSPKVGPLLIFSISLERANKRRKGNSPRTPASRPGPSPHWGDRGQSSPTRRAWGPPRPRSWRPVHTVTYADTFTLAGTLAGSIRTPYMNLNILFWLLFLNKADFNSLSPNLQTYAFFINKFPHFWSVTRLQGIQNKIQNFDRLALEKGKTPLTRNYIDWKLWTVQCCGSGSGIRYLFDPWIRDPGSGIGFFRILDPGSRIPTPFFWELIENFLGKKVL